MTRHTPNRTRKNYVGNPILNIEERNWFHAHIGSCGAFVTHHEVYAAMKSVPRSVYRPLLSERLVRKAEPSAFAQGKECGIWFAQLTLGSTFRPVAPPASAAEAAPEPVEIDTPARLFSFFVGWMQGYWQSQGSPADPHIKCAGPWS